MVRHYSNISIPKDYSDLVVGDGVRRDMSKSVQYFQLASHGGNHLGLKI